MDTANYPNLCEKAIYSEDYHDYILEYYNSQEELIQKTNAVCTQFVDRFTSIGYVPVSDRAEISGMLNTYQRIPRLYGQMDTSAVEEMGVLRVRRQPYLDVFGQGVLIGVVDTGIDYTHPAFRNPDGTTRIDSIWDQTREGGSPPEQFAYGTLYTREEINEALRTERPGDRVPEIDASGHGTFLAGLAAGSILLEEDFTGVAPQAELVVVKLKQAKQYLKEYHCVEQEREAYSEADIMLGIRYLLLAAERLYRPIIILTGMGSSSGSHCGCLPLSRYMAREAVKNGVAMVCSAGNEGNIGHHYQSPVLNAGDMDEWELKIAEGERGLSFEVWVNAPGLGIVELISPLGETTDWIAINQVIQQPIRFPLERTQVYIDYTVVEPNARSELVFIRLLEPTPGIWRIRVRNEVSFPIMFHSWLPIRNFLREGTYFLNPEPDITICEPGNAALVMTATAFDHYNGSIYLQASRGYTIDGTVKPDFAAPGVDIYGPIPGGRYGRMTGTSAAAALSAGCAALLMEWGVTQGNAPELQTSRISNFLVRSADRRDIIYPNRIWGYGQINLYRTFAEIRLP